MLSSAVFGDVLGRDFIAFHRAVALALKVFQRRQGEIGIFCLAVVSAYSPIRHSQGAQEQFPSKKATFNLGKRSITPPKIISPQASMFANGNRRY